MSINVEVKGRQKVLDNIDKFKKISKEEINEGIKELIKKIKISAKENAPVDTGFLRDSITRSTQKTPNGIIGTVSASAHYAIHQEFGTSRGIRPTHFLRRAVQSNRQNLEPELRDAISRSIVKGGL